MQRINGCFATVRTVPLADVASARVECVQCGALTSGGKLFCARHVTRMPYARHLARSLARARSRRQTPVEVAA